VVENGALDRFQFQEQVVVYFERDADHVGALVEGFLGRAVRIGTTGGGGGVVVVVAKEAVDEVVVFACAA